LTFNPDQTEEGNVELTYSKAKLFFSCPTGSGL
jgi:hypothetical protein